MSGLSGVGSGGYNPYVAQQFQQNLFSQIGNGSGSIAQTQLEQAVTASGVTTQGADAPYQQLDPNNTYSVTAQQLAQALPAPPYSDQMQAQMILYQAQGWPGSSTPESGSSLAQSLFSQIDSNGSGSITQTQLEQAVTAAGGTTLGADALYRQLDPNDTGSVSEQQFVSALQPPSPSGNTAQDALLALLDQVTQSSSTSTVSAPGGSSTSSISGSSASDALVALLQSLDEAQSNAPGNTAAGSGTTSIGGNSAQDALDALMARLKADSGSASGAGGSSSTGTANSADLSLAVSFYQSQLNQLVLGGAFGTQAASV
jgi:hypothetical protein